VGALAISVLQLPVEVDQRGWSPLRMLADATVVDLPDRHRVELV